MLVGYVPARFVASQLVKEYGPVARLNGLGKDCEYEAVHPKQSKKQSRRSLFMGFLK